MANNTRFTPLALNPNVIPSWAGTTRSLSLNVETISKLNDPYGSFGDIGVAVAACSSCCHNPTTNDCIAITVTVTMCIPILTLA